MRYALWDLKEDVTNYLSGPEARIIELGGTAEASWANGMVENGADILGYVFGEFDINELAHWNYQEVTQEQALSFCLSINPDAYILANGKIAVPIEEN